MLNSCHEILLAHDTFHLVMSNDFAFTQLLQGVGSSGTLVTDQPHLTKGTDTENTKLDEILEANVRSLVSSAGGRSTQTLNGANDTLNVLLGKNTTRRFGLHRNGILAGSIVSFLDGIFSKVIGIRLGNNFTILGNNDRSVTDNVKVMLKGLSFLRQYRARRIVDFLDAVRKASQFVGLELRIRNDGDTEQGSFAHGRVNGILEWSQDQFERFTVQDETRRLRDGRNVGHAWVSRNEGTFTKKLTDTHFLVYVGRITKSNIMDLDPSFSDDIKVFTDFTLLDDARTWFKHLLRKGVGNSLEVKLLQIRQEWDLLECFVNILLL
mmetsp:Transcript_17773/g.33739  ORF Transcript_17773/g.33739 Transcript_17773/m.33739 type:complete len:323 (+) Transcript_17773:123-1091(+)